MPYNINDGRDGQVLPLGGLGCSGCIRRYVPRQQVLARAAGPVRRRELRRSSGAASYYLDGLNDFSFANWEKDGGLTTLIVEARPRDGGFTLESYSLEDNGTHLRVKMRIEPDNFNAPIELTRVYRRK